MEVMYYIKLRESNPEEMELEAMADNYDTYISMRREPMSTKK